MKYLLSTACITILLLLLLATGIVAAEQLSLEQCVEIALRQNSGIKSMEMQVKASQAEVEISRTALLPVLKGRATYSVFDEPGRLVIPGNAFGPGVPPQSTSVNTGGKDHYLYGLVVQQPIFMGGARYQEYRRSDFHAQAEYATLAWSQRELIFQVKEAFYNVLSARMAVSAFERIVMSRQEQLRVLKERTGEGVADRAEFLKASADLADAEAELNVRKNRSLLAETTLRNRIGVESDKPLDIYGKPQRVELTLLLDEFIVDGLDKREDLRALHSRAQAAESSVSIAKSAYFPKVSLEGSYLRQRETTIDRPESWAMMLQAEWSIFEWGRTNADVARATAETRRRNFELDQARKQTRLDIETAWRSVKDHELFLAAAEKRLQAVEFAYHQACDRGVDGASLMAEVLESEALLRVSNTDYYQKACDLLIAVAKLEAVAARELSSHLTIHELYSPDIKVFTGYDMQQSLVQDLPKLEPQLPPVPIPESSASLPTQPSVEMPKQYAVQLGAYKGKSFAERFKTQLQPGLQDVSLTVMEEGKLFKVFAGPFPTREAAIAMVNKYKIESFMIKPWPAP